MNLKQDTTLDILYTNKLKYFQNKFNIIIPKLNKKIEELNEIKTAENEKEINIKIEYYESKIKLIINEKDKYFLDNSKYLFEYFETKQNIDKNNTPKKTINSFFNFTC
jgi:F420-0:gamma-glutamyl ligase